MADQLPRVSPLASLARPGRGIAGPDPVTLSALPFAGRLILRGDPALLAEAWGGPLGTAFPEPLEAVVQGDLTLYWLGPDEWLLRLPHDRVAATVRELRQAAGDRHHAVVDVSDRLHGIAVEGGHAREVLNAGIALDLHVRAFPEGAVARTLLGKAAVTLHRPAGLRFELTLNGSFAPYAWLFLENAAREFGYAIAA